MTKSVPALAWEIDYYVVKDQAEPFQIHSTPGKHHGIISDIISTALEDSEHSFNPQILPFKRMYAQLEKEQMKNWVTFGSPLWGDMQSSNLSTTPIIDVQHTLMTSAKSDFHYASEHDLQKKHVILLFGFDYPGLTRMIQQGAVKSINVKSYDAAFDLSETQRKNLAGFVEMNLRIKYNLNKSGRDTSNFKFFSLSDVIPDYKIYLAYSPGIDDEIKSFFDIKLAEMRLDGRLETIINRYRY
ncbi:amino acid ABC transporter [Veronia nyctiphanis]|uniref:Amino acid ABC transporter n=1 Tax=Veronia nyctiphanis TaxID=1278244 RepID=A0A4Q0YMF2_9GAMM|nr:ABC transporter substrate-binding protein [Veronia nyctiphanis]RXJ72010.1 amino acid ABC transporter [Veronia nyctiphanis]